MTAVGRSPQAHRRRIGAYGVCRDGDGRVLLVRASERSTRPGTWFLPGGGVEHGEHPADAVVREVAEETGLAATVERVLDVAAELVIRPPHLEQTDGVIYRLAVTGGALRPEPDGTSDRAEWLRPEQVAVLPRSRFVALALGLPAPPDPPVPPPDQPVPGAGPQPRPPRGQRFAAYALVTDPAGRVLLTRIADGFPAVGRWHLPGGGTDFGEQPRDALRREILEESGQTGQVTELLTVSHHHNQTALGPGRAEPAERGPSARRREASRAVKRPERMTQGYPIDWHSVRAVFRVEVAVPTHPEVREQGGSTAEAGWFTRAEAAALPLTEIAASVLGA